MTAQTAARTRTRRVADETSVVDVSDAGIANAVRAGRLEPEEAHAIRVLIDGGLVRQSGALPPGVPTSARNVRLSHVVVAAQAAIDRGDTTEGLARDVAIWEDLDGWRVAVFNGAGVAIADQSPLPLEHEAARRVANHAWQLLRAAAAADPDTWRVL